MIIKTDFVTNSSSTIFLVYIPKEYPFTISKMVYHFNNQKEWYSEEDWEPYDTPHQIENACNVILDRLKNGEPFYNWGGEVPSLFWNVVENLLDEEGLIIHRIETGVSGENSFYPISEESISNIMKLKTVYGGDE